MFAVVCNEFGPIGNLEYREVETPTPGPGEVRISVCAAGVNFPDALLVQGLYQLKPPTPFVPGSEFAGVIEKLGEGVENFRVGDRVLTLSTRMGGFAEKAIVDASALVRLDDRMPFKDAATLLCAHGTAHHALKQRANLQPAEDLVVLGAAGGTGLAAVQIGKVMGARVIAVCSTQEKLGVARENGADVLIQAGEADLKEAIKEVTGGKGADVVYDVVGGDAFAACSRAMARNGRLLVVGFASGEIPKLAVNLPLLKEYAVVGVFWGNWAAHEPPALAANLDEMFGWYADGKIRVVVDAEYPLVETAQALARMQQRDVKGKLVIRI